MNKQLVTTGDDVCFCFPLYIDKDMRRYYGHHVKTALKKRLTEEIERATPNLCNVKTSGFGYECHAFGCKHATASPDSTSTANQKDDTTSTKNEVPLVLHLLLDLPVAARQFIVAVLKNMSPYLTTMVGLMPFTLTFPHATMDIGSGHTKEMAIWANFFGTAANSGASTFVSRWATATAIASTGAAITGPAIAAALFAVAIGTAANIGTAKLI